jgi:hypothetical protein
MKQNITPVQWEELTTKQQSEFLHCIYESVSHEVDRFDWQVVRIGTMIQFLGTEKICYIDDNAETVCWQTTDDRKYGVAMGWWGEEELCDVLWELCKFKLKNR